VSGVAGQAGPRWERTVADYARDAWGLPWDRAPLRGSRDLLDIQGCLPGGFLVGCKAIRRGTSFGQKISEAMDQCDRALVNLGRPGTRNAHGHLVVMSGGVVPVQVMQRSGYHPGKAYVVTELDYFLDLAVRRQKWRDDELWIPSDGSSSRCTAWPVMMSFRRSSAARSMTGGPACSASTSGHLTT
jgi:hypothetical protein